MIESIAITNFYCFNETTKISFVAGRERNRLSDILFAGYEPLNHVNMLKMAFLSAQIPSVEQVSIHTPV